MLAKVIIIYIGGARLNWTHGGGESKGKWMFFGGEGGLLLTPMGSV